LSNTALQVVKELKDHSLKNMMDLGIKTTINSDDPAYFGGQVNQNYIDTQIALDLTEEEIYQLAQNSFIYSFLPEYEKTSFLKELDDYYFSNKS